MTSKQIGRYSKYIRSISLFFDLLIIDGLSLFFYQNKDLRVPFSYFLPYLTITWICISLIIGFYAVYRFTTPVEIIKKIIKQFSVFLLIVIAFFPFAKTTIFSGRITAIYMIIAFIIIFSVKFLLFFYLKKYRIITGNNIRKAVILGYSKDAIKLKEIFETRIDYGYQFFGFFSDKKQRPEIKGKIDDLKAFVIENKIDEIYCSLKEISDEKLKDLVDFADDYHKTIKFIPDSKAIYARNLKIDYYELFPVLSLEITKLHNPYVQAFKRAFDIVFSLLVIILLLSWLVPILAILIKIESKGPVFFNQLRNGLDEVPFLCFKFRSMKLNNEIDKLATKNDPRVTRIGIYMRKTSIDELPQFFNVLLGDMSVVGPRPHILSQNQIYSDKIKKFNVRHYVKPGVTGLAQVKGFRGEIESDDDMINRIRMDVFYIENWSLFLDIKIIIQTVINIFKGDKKAY